MDDYRLSKEPQAVKRDKFKVMIVEDERLVAHDLEVELTDLGYEVVSTPSSGEEAVEKAKELHPDLILMDIVLSGKMNGIQATEEIQKDFETAVVYLTAYDDDKMFNKARATFLSGYILKPVQKRQLYIALELALQTQNMEKNLKEKHAKIFSSMKDIIKTLADTIESKFYGPGHHERVITLACAIAREMGLSDFQVEAIELAAAIYDIGMVTIPIDILREGERLEGIKKDMYQTYPAAAYSMLKKVEFLWPIADIVLQHRECYDGSGFPRNLKGETILSEARILSVAQSLEDLMSHQSYRPALNLPEALQVLVSRSGSSFDPQVVKSCLSLFEEKGFNWERER